MQAAPKSNELYGDARSLGVQVKELDLLALYSGGLLVWRTGQTRDLRAESH